MKAMLRPSCEKCLCLSLTLIERRLPVVSGWSPHSFRGRTLAPWKNCFQQSRARRVFIPLLKKRKTVKERVLCDEAP